MTDTHIKINAVTPRVQYTGNGSTTVFPYEFAIFDETDMVVYVDDEIITTGYTVSGAGQTDGGNVTFDSAPADGTIITLLRNVPIERMTDFQEGGTFRPKNINDEFDRQTAFAQQVQEALSRCVKVDPTSESNPEEILPKVEELYDDIDNINAVAGDLANVDAVATNMSDVNDCATNISAIQDAPTQASNAANSATAAANSASAAALSAASCMPILFDHKWVDHEVDNMAWLRADTFSWQDGTVYSNAYNHLVADYSGGTSQTETVGSYTITYVLATDGHKITTDETNVANIYNESGVAWYYILDTTNQRFKLPRENPAREKLIQVVRAKGNGITLGLTDGTNNLGLQNGTNPYKTEVASGSYNKNVGTASVPNSSNAVTLGITTDSTKSGIISSMTESTSVYKGKKYLYFYVGQFSQSATEQTAGLNASLFNGKVDLDAGNLNNAGKSLIAGLGMPSDAYEDLTLLASGQTYTAPANGYFYAGFSSCTDLSMYKLDSNNNDVYAIGGGYPSGGHNITMQVKKNDVVKLYYNGSKTYFRFVYAEGSESEAS